MSCRSFQKRVFALLLGSMLCLQAQALTITATASDIADTPLGGDRWQMSYRVTGALPLFHAITLQLSPSTFGDVEATSVPAAFDVALTPGGFGFDTLLTFTAISALADGEAVDAIFAFTRLAGPPFAAQSFDVADDTGAFASSGVVEFAVAGPNEIPEPASWMLIGLGMAMLRRKASPPPAY